MIQGSRTEGGIQKYMVQHGWGRDGYESARYTRGKHKFADTNRQDASAKYSQQAYSQHKIDDDDIDTFHAMPHAV